MTMEHALQVGEHRYVWFCDHCWPTAKRFAAVIDDCECADYRARDGGKEGTT